MSLGLLDVNALIALLWEEHPFHRSCAAWFAESSQSGWATCPITETGCARIISNPAFTARAPSFREVNKLLQTTTASHPHHHFWPDDLRLSALTGTNLGHQQITDAYLLALAVHHKGKLVTFDRRIKQLAPDGSKEQAALLFLNDKTA